jgi:hypothetical protein
MQAIGPLTGWRLFSLYAVLALLVTAPVLTVQVPLLGDYPNHLARIHILENLRPGSVLATYYERPSRLVPYQAMDVVVGALRAVMPLYLAGRVFIALCLLGPPAAAAALRYAALGRIGIAPAAGFLLSYNFLIARGLLDYLFSTFLALGLFAVWLLARGWPRWRRAALCGAGLAVVFLFHAYAGITYCLLVAGDVLACAARHRFKPVRVVLLDVVAASCQALPCLVLVAAFGASGSFGTAPVTEFGELSRKAATLLTPVMFPGPNWLFVALGLTLLIGALLFATRSVRLAPALVGPAVAIAVAAAAAPSVLLNAWATDMRLPIVLCVVVLAGAVPRTSLGPRLFMAFAVALLLLTGARGVSAFQLLHALDAQAAQIRAIAAALPQGARLLVVDDESPAPLRVAEPFLTDHAPLLAAIERDAFVPYLLTGATPLVTRPAYRAASSPNAGPIDMAQLRDGAARHDPSGPLPSYGYGGNVYWLGWPHKFDDVLIMNYDGDAGPLPAGLREVARTGIAVLYEVRRPGALPLDPAKGYSP